MMVGEGVVSKTGGSKKSNRGSVALTARLKSSDSDKETKLTFYDAEADHKKEQYASGRPILGVKDQWQLSPDHEKQSAVWLLDKPFQAKQGDELIVSLGNVMANSVRVSVTPFAGEDPLESGASERLRKTLQN